MYKTPEAQKLTVKELTRLSRAPSLTIVCVVMTQSVGDYLLSLNTNNRRVNQKKVAELVGEIRRVGWFDIETMCVTKDGKLGNGQHSLLALRSLG